MKKIIILLVSLVVVQSGVRADDDKPISFSQLPNRSQQLIKEHFGELSIALVKMERDFFDKSYEVIFTNGNKVEFDRKGNWKDIDCKHTEIPNEIIPSQIRSYISQNHPNVKIVKIEKEDRNRYEVDLANNVDLTFDSQFNLVDIDY